VVITGLRKDEFGLVLSSMDGMYLGIMEFMSHEDRIRLYKNKKVIETTDKLTKIEPIKCQIKYRELTKKGLLRIPSFQKWII
jgi:DNA ligase 1